MCECVSGVCEIRKGYLKIDLCNTRNTNNTEHIITNRYVMLQD